MGRHHRRKGWLRADVRSTEKRGQAGRRALLAGTALVSTLIASSPTPTLAQQAVFIPASPFPVTVTNNQNCVFPGTCALIGTVGIGASIDFTNTGNFATIGLGAIGITTNSAALGGSITVNNSGNLATAGLGAIGIESFTVGPFSPIVITNSGDIATAGIGAIGISANTRVLATNSPITITNSGGIATAALRADGIFATTSGTNSGISVMNSGDIFTRGEEAEGIIVGTEGRNAGISITNSGTISTSGRSAEGINALTRGVNSDIAITNSGDIETRGIRAAGIFATTYSQGSSISIVNSGTAKAFGPQGFGIYAQTYEPSSPVLIENSGDVYGSSVGIYTFSSTSTTILNSGSISAGTNLAINTGGAGTTIKNTGLITGFVDLSDSPDFFWNAGGEFNAKKTSSFGGGTDVFIDESGAIVRTATSGSGTEFTSFEGLEQFQNRGLITMQDGAAGDVFKMSNTVGGTNLAFSGNGNSTLAVDTFLGGPGTSKSDVLIIEGDATGQTEVKVLNTNPGAAQLDRKGIPVVYVEGKVDKSAFFLEKPIDAGFFDYDLIFRPTGSGVFELKSHPGGGSHVLPHVVTFSHDTFHNTTETWFDQSTDLRSLLAEGSVCSDPARKQDVVRCQELYDFTPGVWVRGAGAWLDLQDDASTKANGKTYRYNLDRDLDIWNFETGIDFGKRDLIANGDILVFGVLGGAVESTLDYRALSRSFHLGGGEAGAYATYLNGGLFVDTLFKAQFMKLDPADVRGFPNKLDSNTYGFRTDTGYRFGGVRSGPFIEPLATIAVSWNETDDFSVDGVAVDFNDDEDVRGRVGMRVGTSMDVWEGTTMEPFVVGSLWGNLSGSHSATLSSSGETFAFTDDPEEVWGVVSGGVNFFNPGAQSSVFTKIDYTFADQTQGVSVKGGMRYNW